MSYYDILLAKQLSGGGGGGDITVESLSVTANGTYSAPTGKAYSPVEANVPNSYTASDEGKVVSSGALVAQTSQTIDTNGTYDTTLKNSVTVNVSGGGDGMTLLYSGEVTTSYNSTTASLVKTIESLSGVWDIDAIIYVKIRDKAGKREGYFYGSDSFMIRINTTSPMRNMYRSAFYVNSDGTLGEYRNPTNSSYGVYPNSISSNGNVDIYEKYSSTNSLTIDGTYSIKIYKITA